MKHNIISWITTLCLMTGFMTSTVASAEISTENSSTIKIMSIGDSITDGYWEQGAYRKYMYNSLVSNGITNVDMVGPKGSNEESYSGGELSFNYDGNYCGYSGYAIEDISGTETRSGIYQVLTGGNMLETYNPDIVLLQIGTNDILSAYNDGIIDRLGNLTDYILSYMNDNDDTLFVTTIPNIDVAEVYTWFWAYGDEYYGVSQEDFAIKVQAYIDSYNSQIKDMVQQKQSEGCTHIQFADINSVVDYQTDLYDGVHPNEQGYQKMGEYWSDVLTSYLSGNDNPSGEVTEVTTTEPIIETTAIGTSEPVTSITPLGDINKDGELSYIDLFAMKKHILEASKIEDVSLADMNLDGSINVLDLILLKNTILK